MIKRTIIAALAAAAMLTASAQSDDFGYDISLAAETRLAKGLKLEVDAAMRTQDDAKKIDRYTVGAELSYRLIAAKKRQPVSLKVNGGFEYLWTNHLAEVTDKYYDGEIEEYVGDFWGTNTTEHYWRNRYRFNLGFTAGYQFNKRWSVSLKETVQYNHYCCATAEKTKYRPYGINGDDEWYEKDPEYADEYAEAGNPIIESETKCMQPKDRTLLHSKLTVDYNIKGYPINLFASADYGCGLDHKANKWKFIGGYDFKIDRHNQFSVYYRYNTESDDDEAGGHLVGLGYKLSF